MAGRRDDDPSGRQSPLLGGGSFSSALGAASFSSALGAGRFGGSAGGGAGLAVSGGAARFAGSAAGADLGGSGAGSGLAGSAVTTALAGSAAGADAFAASVVPVGLATSPEGAGFDASGGRRLAGIVGRPLARLAVRRRVELHADAHLRLAHVNFLLPRRVAGQRNLDQRGLITGDGNPLRCGSLRLSVDHDLAMGRRRPDDQRRRRPAEVPGDRRRAPDRRRSPPAWRSRSDRDGR